MMYGRGSVSKNEDYVRYSPIESMMIILKLFVLVSCPSIPTRLHTSPSTEYTTQKLVYPSPLFPL